MKNRPGAVYTIFLLLSTPLVLTLAGCRIVIDEMIANTTIAADDSKKPINQIIILKTPGVGG